ncbi:MAG TPA: hypothetical protein VLH09_05365 [Bryobacteraceae bacterium]|nr:hypothetical protein [Bryobacteraceae bacterium]
MVATIKSRLCFRAVIRELLLDPTGSQFAMQFKVEPVGVTVPGLESDGMLSNVFMRIPGFGSYEKGSKPDGYSGILFMPEVGSQVFVEQEGTLFFITGFYTGPVTTPTETGADPERRRISHNPGLEVDRSRQSAAPGTNLPHWSGGLAPGDVILFRGHQRVKLTSTGLYVGSDLDNFIYFSPLGDRISRYGKSEERAPGLHNVHQSDLGLTGVGDALTDAVIPPEPSAGAYVCKVEVLDAAPCPTLGRPFRVRQSGHVAASTLDEGHAAPVTGVTASEILVEAETGCFTVEHLCWAWPLDGEAPIPRSSELDITAAPVFDYQQDSDGSFRIRAGNAQQAPGAQRKGKPTQLDMNLEYDAERQTFTLRLGRAGSPAATVEISGDDPATSSVKVRAAAVAVEGANQVTFSAGTTLKVVAPAIKLDGNVEVTGTTTFKGEVTGAKEATFMGIPVTKHMHPYTDDGSPSQTSVPIA